MAKRNALGKGLTALLSDSKTDVTGDDSVAVNNISEIPVNQIEANPFQPRGNIENEDLHELIGSIQMHGIIQPITVRKIGYDQYQIISGERRARGAIQAGLKKVPAFVRVANDQNMLEMALIENIHRENLNAVEVALSYKRLVDECEITQDELASRIGKDRTTVANYLRLLKLPEEIQIAITENRLSMGHARALININDENLQLEVFKEIMDQNLSVRNVEEMVKQKREKGKQKAKKAQKPEKNQTMIDWEKKLSNNYQSKVKINPKHKGKGELVIPFNSEGELEKIAHLLEGDQ
ncbi:MAG: chromosome partitioning protein ParB [Bacteroidetes bacterium SW_10_40_5]|nr:MAG: chromosome partitioning protein ParB [Bacteroidetes bacterium SW_10_40_5]